MPVKSTWVKAMSLYDLYDSFHPVYTRIQCAKGGKRRVETGKRDRWGRLLPHSGELPEPTEHGRKGGLKRALTGKKVNGKYVKE